FIQTNIFGLYQETIRMMQVINLVFNLHSIILKHCGVSQKLLSVFIPDMDQVFQKIEIPVHAIIYFRVMVINDSCPVNFRWRWRHSIPDQDICSIPERIIASLIILYEK